MPPIATKMLQSRERSDVPKAAMLTPLDFGEQ
jgi:hypothetical protein